jgi:hypothetical protein
MKKLGFISLFLLATASTFASVPPTSKSVSDEITTPRQGRLSFEQDLKNLNEMEARYHERLPRLADRPELASPIKRISARKYKAKQRAGRVPHKRAADQQ